MLLVIGGAFQGKLDTASHLSGIPKEEFLDGRSCPFEEVFRGSGIHHFEEYIRRWIKEGKNTEELTERLKKENPAIVVRWDMGSSPWTRLNGIFGSAPDVSAVSLPGRQAR